MGKYTALEDNVFDVFDSAEWKALSIPTFPTNFVVDDAGIPFIRVNILPASRGINLVSVSGMLMIDIFTSAGEGPNPAFDIADKLDTFLQGKNLDAGNGNTQFHSSSFGVKGPDVDDPTLFRTTYSIPFNYFGV